MDRKAMTKDMKDFRGGRGFICVEQLAEYRGIGKDKARQIVIGLPFIREGNRKDFQVEDVIDRLWESRELGG